MIDLKNISLLLTVFKGRAILYLFCAGGPAYLLAVPGDEFLHPMTTASSPRPFRRRLPWQAVIDCLVLFLWSFVLIRFAVTGKLFLLLHPDYMWLSHLAAVMLFGLGTMRAVQIWQSFANPLSQPGFRSEEHIALMPRQISTGLLLAIAMFGLIYSPRPFTSEDRLSTGNHRRSGPDPFSARAVCAQRYP